MPKAAGKESSGGAGCCAAGVCAMKGLRMEEKGDAYECPETGTDETGVKKGAVKESYGGVQVERGERSTLERDRGEQSCTKRRGSRSRGGGSKGGRNRSGSKGGGSRGGGRRSGSRGGGSRGGGRCSSNRGGGGRGCRGGRSDVIRANDGQVDLTRGSRSIDDLASVVNRGQRGSRGKPV